MKYLCIVHQNEATLKKMPEPEHRALTNESLDYNETLRKSGHYVNANALEFVDQAKTLRLKKGKVVVTDGPFAETREQIGGYMLIEAKDINEAIQLAAKMPPIRLGGIEVRAVRELTYSPEGCPR